MALKLHRRCVSCHCTAQRDEFWRLVRVPIAKTPDPTDGTEITDQSTEQHLDPKRFQIQLGQGMGRSAYLCKKLDCLQIAQKKNRLGRSLRMPIPIEIFETLKTDLSTLKED